MRLAAVFALVALLAIVDLAGDLRRGTTPTHVGIEGTVALVGLAGIVWAWARFRGFSLEAASLRRQARDLEEHLSVSRSEARRWQAQAADLISGLSAAIDQQLDRWNLSSAEKEIALLLLKGLSHKEIAAVRNVSEATVRQQAAAIYRKAGLSGRRDLAAFFLEDLLGPRGASANAS
jgi:DNA-binding CsgD family transcriptional regulator